jgi:hypothetical protein
MNEEYYVVKTKLIEYLRESKIPISDSDTEQPVVMCPCCRGNARIVIVPLLERQSFWKCLDCGEQGDVVKFAKEHFQFRNEAQALQDVCRKLHVPITVLDTVSGRDLLKKEYEPLTEIVQGLIAPGLYILAGPPKTGKSWLALDLSVAVSNGESLWDQETIKSDVLYLALEDAEQRLQKRLQLISDGEIGNIYFATEVEAVGEGFEGQISAFLEYNKNIRLVVVDTFGKARGTNAGKCGYIEDYAVMTSLKKLAMRFNVAVVLVHHTRKKEADDIMDMISGTNGIFGCADGAMVLLRSGRLGDEATLYTTSRDFEDKKFCIRLNKEIMRWELREDNGRHENNDIVSAVVCHVRKMRYWEGTATDLLEELLKIDEWIRTKPNGLARTLNNEKKKLREKYNIEYRKGRDDSDKLIILIDCKGKDSFNEE